MNLRSLLGGRKRKETREYRISDAVHERAVNNLVVGGLQIEQARLCVHQLVSGSADAFARAYGYVSGLGVSASVFRKWCVTHGFHDVIGEHCDRCAWCGNRIVNVGEVHADSDHVFLRCAACCAKEISLAEIAREFRKDTK